MKYKSLFLLGVLFFTSFIIIIRPSKGTIRDQTVSTIAQKDTYVNSYDPTSNFGGQDYAMSGFYYTGDIVEAYFFFNFTDKPTNYTKAEISLDLWSVSETINITICLIEDVWDEYTMTWLSNKPAKGNQIISSVITQDDIYKFDVTSYIEGRSNISICVYITFDNYVDDYFYITTREGVSSYSPEEAPQLIWTYSETAEITVTSPKSSDIWQDFNSYNIRWTSQGIIENVLIQLYKGTRLIENITYTYTANDGEYEFYFFSSDDDRGTDYRIKITDYDDSSVYDYSDYFTINIGSGTITVTSPSSSSSWKAGGKYSITWTTTGTVINVDIEIYKEDTLMYYIYDVSNLGSKLWEIDEDAKIGTDWRVKISNSDDPDQNDWSDYFSIYKKSSLVILGYYLIPLIVISFGIIIFLIMKFKKTALY